MANHCHQTLIIKGNQNTIEEITSLLIEDNKYIRFSNLLPIPSDEELKELQLSKSEWCTKKYEVSCDFGILQGTEITGNQVRIDFHTNYTPCRQFVYHLSHLYTEVNLKLSFVEPYGGFRGYVECENSEVLKDHIEDFDRETGEVIDFIAKPESIPEDAPLAQREIYKPRINLDDMTDVENFLSSI